MRVSLAKSLGFCFGVKRAVEMVTKVRDSNVYTLGPIIHNPQEVKRLENMGIKPVDSLEGLSSGTVVIRAHGVSPEVEEGIRKRGLNMVDATCPYVKKTHHIVGDFSGKGYTIIILGDKNHPEVRGVVGYAGKDVFVVNSVDDIKRLNLKSQRVCFVSQTTHSPETMSEIRGYLEKEASELEFYDTICNATKENQDAAVELAKENEVVVVIGGKESNNTKKLVEVCRPFCKVIHVESADEIGKDDFLGVEKVGVTAGASTPDWVIRDVVKKLK